MERLIKHWDNNYVATKLNYDFVWELSEEDFKYFNDIIKKLAKYEDFEEELESVYGEHDGLLKTMVKSLVRHEGADIGKPCKARLLTDEDVDKWEMLKDLGEHDKLIKLPCKVGDIVYNIVPLRNNNFTYREDEVSKIILEEDGVKIFFKNGLGKCIEDFGKTMFLTKEEMEKQIWLKK